MASENHAVPVVCTSSGVGKTAERILGRSCSSGGQGRLSLLHSTVLEYLSCAGRKLIWGCGRAWCVMLSHPCILRRFGLLLVHFRGQCWAGLSCCRACESKPGHSHTEKKTLKCRAVYEKYLSSKDRNGKDIRERTDCSLP